MIRSGAETRFAEWVPGDLTDWLDRISASYPKDKYLGYEKLATRLEMKSVWEWFALHHDEFQLNHVFLDGPARWFCIVIQRCINFPGKPGDMPPKRRAEYLEKVRRHAAALAELLADTRFDCGSDEGRNLSSEDEIAEGKVPLKLRHAVDNLRSRSDEYIAAYKVSEEGIFELPWDYPNCYLVEQLYDLVGWANETDYWGRGWVSSKPIRHGGPSARAIHFNCTLYELFLRATGVEIPYEILATIANVALELQFENIVSAESARKQVTRYMDRVGRPPLPTLEESPF